MRHPPFRSTWQRNSVVLGVVLLLHGLGLWVLQQGIRLPPSESVVAVHLVSEWVPAPRKPPVPPHPQQPAVVKATHPAQAAKTTALMPDASAIAATPPAPNAPTGVTTPAPVTSSVAASAATTGPAAAPKVELPSSDAEYLHNPKPDYPKISKQLGEQGTVIVNVLISAEGLAQEVILQQSSHFDRLDQAAMATVKSWHFVPGKHNGAPKTMWFAVPVRFVLE